MRLSTGNRTHWQAGIVLSLMLCAAAPLRAQPAQYAVIDLDTLGGEVSLAPDVNEDGQVVGHSELPDFALHAFRWEDGVMTDLGTLGGPGSLGYAILEDGTVAGAADLPLPGLSHAYISPPRRRHD